MKEIWQTTNQQPWVEALASNLISVKTRMSFPNVPVGATVLLHASKARLWPYWKGLKWATKLNPDSWERGKIVAIATVAEIDASNKILTKKETGFWDVFWPDTNNEEFWYNSVGTYAVRFSNIKRLKNPIEARGYQSPYVKAKKETVDKILKNNPELKPLLK